MQPLQALCTVRRDALITALFRRMDLYLMLCTKRCNYFGYCGVGVVTESE